MPNLKYNRILLKLSGEALSGSKNFGIDADTIGKVCDDIKVLYDTGVQISIVVGDQVLSPNKLASNSLLNALDEKAEQVAKVLR